MTEWENNSNVAVQDPDELGDEVKVEAEVDHGQNQGAWEVQVINCLEQD